MSWEDILKTKFPLRTPLVGTDYYKRNENKLTDKIKDKKEYVVISKPYESPSNQKEIEVYWGYGDGGEGETIATFTDKDRDDVYDWVENWLKKNGYKDIDIEYE